VGSTVYFSANIPFRVVYIFGNSRDPHAGPVAYGASWHVQLGFSDWTATTDPMAGQWGHLAGPNARMAWLYVRVRSDSRRVGVRMH
jgi:hypothetical protein